jgi:unsaturated rhamnogalacturonyl hydrolase
MDFTWDWPEGVSAGTAVMKNAGGYCTVPKQRIQGWGQGLALVFLAVLLEKSTSIEKEV